MSHDIKSAERPAPDSILTAIADYALSVEIKNELAYETAGYCLMDTLACGFQASLSEGTRSSTRRVVPPS